MKQILYCGSTSDGKEHWVEIDSENPYTGICRSFTTPLNNPREEIKREYYPFLED